MSMGDLPESLSQAILVGVIFVGRLGVMITIATSSHAFDAAALLFFCFLRTFLTLLIYMFLLLVLVYCHITILIILCVCFIIPLLLSYISILFLLFCIFMS